MLSGIPMPLPLFAVAFTRSRRANQDVVPSPSFGLHAAGVGSRRTSLPKFLACPLPVSGCVVGVGSSETAVRKSMPPAPCKPDPFVSDVRGVGSSLSG